MAADVVHLLFDGEDDQIEELQHGLEQLLIDNTCVTFRMHGVIVEDYELLEGLSQPGKARTVDEKILPWLEYSLNSNLIMHYCEPLPRKRIAWQDILSDIQLQRRKEDIPPTDLAILLTPKGNEYNWFSSFRSRPTPDGFVQTSDWEHFIHAPVWYPIAYHIWTIILQLRGFGSLKETTRFLHATPRGCINDFCEEKSDVHIKMRTADVCSDCITVMTNNGLSYELLYHATIALEKIRRESQFLKLPLANQTPSPLIVDDSGGLSFPAYHELRVKLSPIEKSLYIFYLQHPEGISLTEMSDFKSELLLIYRRIRNIDHEDAMPVINKLVNPLDNSLNEKISRINAKLKSILYLPERSVHYLITRKDGRYSIPLPVELIKSSSWC